MRRLKIAVIGCGTISQIMHIPYLKELEDRFKITAVCDISPKLVNKIGDSYNIKDRYTDFCTCIEKADIDAVLIATPRNHSEIAILAANCGKHVFTEKPMCISMPEADTMIEAADANKVKLMVGHMRLFDPGFQYVQKVVKETKDISLVRQHTSRGPGVPLSDIYTLYRYDDIPDKEKKKAQEFISEKKSQLTGLSEKARDLYLSLIGGAIHDIYILRGLFGTPRKVLFTKSWGVGCLVSVLEYSDTFKCIYSTGPWDMKVDDFDIGFTIYGRDRVIDFKFTYDSFLKNDPSSVIIREMEGKSFVEKKVRSFSFDESFRRELIHFHDCVTNDKEPLSSGREAKKDLQLLMEIAKQAG